MTGLTIPPWKFFFAKRYIWRLPGYTWGIHLAWLTYILDTPKKYIWEYSWGTVKYDFRMIDKIWIVESSKIWIFQGHVQYSMNISRYVSKRYEFSSVMSELCKVKYDNYFWPLDRNICYCKKVWHKLSNVWIKSSNIWANVQKCLNWVQIRLKWIHKCLDLVQ